MALLLGIDAGTTSVSAVAYDTGRGEVIWHGCEPHGAYVTGLPAGHREQDPLRILSCMYALLDRLPAEAGHSIAPDSICVTGQMHGFLLLGPGGEMLTRFITWEDTRILDERAPSSTAEGVSSGPGYAAANLYWLKRNGRIPAEDFTLCSIQDWLTFELSGRKLRQITTDPSCAHSTGLFMPISGRWDTDLAGEIGLTSGQLPAIEPTGRIIGRSAAIGALPAGVPLCTGLGDNQASFLGSVADPSTTALVNVGTGSQITVWSKCFRSIEGLDTRPYPGDTFIIVGAPLCGGRVFSSVRDLVDEIGSVFFEVESTGDDIYRRLIETAIYQTDLRCKTTFSGSRIDPDERGSMENLSLDNFTIGDISGAIIHGISDELFELYTRTGVHSRSLIGSGNGIRRNPLLARSIAEHFSLPLERAPFEEEAALGAALVSGKGTGVFADFEAVNREVKRMRKRSG